MEGVITENAPAEENTAGKEASQPTPTLQNNISEEKLLPAGTPEKKADAPGAPSAAPQNATEKALPVLAVPPWIKDAASKTGTGLGKLTDLSDILHRGNAVSEAQSKPSLAIVSGPYDEESGMPIERNLREVGLKEALPRSGAEPPRAQVFGAESSEELPVVHTYAEDVGKEIKKRGVTLSSIITAEKMAPAREPAPAPQRPTRLIFLGGAAILLLLGIGAVAGVLSFIPHPPTVVAGPSLIPVNHRVSVSADSSKSLSQTLAGIKAKAHMSLGEIEEIDILRNGALLSPAEVLTALGAPDELARNATAILVGVHAGNGTQPFILVSVSDYDRAFHAMLVWERGMGDSLGFFFAPNGVMPESVTTRAPTLSFTDRVFANLDVRESQSAWPILYAFMSQSILLMTTNDSTVREVITRLSLQSKSN